MFGGGGKYHVHVFGVMRIRGQYQRVSTAIKAAHYVVSANNANDPYGAISGALLGVYEDIAALGVDVIHAVSLHL